jgi:Fe2+ transport system protein FeoA
MLTLNELKTGQTACILNIPDMDIATQALRMGLFQGEQITCVAKVPAGPTVVRQGGMEVAIGQQLCQAIQVELV